jgi:formate dehydrogenase accessory protein FdhE
LTRPSAVDARRAARATRARTLLAERPHTEPLLRFYLSILDLQAAVCHSGDAARWLPEVVEVSASERPRLRLERLPLDELSPRFREFCKGVPPSAPEPISVAARAVFEGDAARRTELLLTLLTGADFQAGAVAFASEPVPLAFLARGFLSPIAEVLSDLVDVPADAERSPLCPCCGWPPQVAMLRDETETKGIRRLVCAFCATAWVFPRSACPSCSTMDEKCLELHVDDGAPHVRVEACTHCRRYLKSIDFRVFGLAEPLVDDLATPELDLWAEEQGLEKITPNLLGL